MGDPRFSPVVAVDLDGVLRLLVNLGGTLPFDAFNAQVTLRRDPYPTLFHSAPAWDDNGENTDWETFSGIGAAWVRDLITREIDVVWATTWQEHANTYFADVLGIPYLPNALDAHRPRFTESAPSWKARNLVAKFPGRPILWVDDTLPFWDHGYFAEERAPKDRALTLFHHIRNSAFGIQEADATEMNNWLDLASTAEGQDELRQRRRTLLSQQRKIGLR